MKPDLYAADSLSSVLESLGVVVLERGWLSSNNVVLLADDGAAIVDTGYATHASTTVSLVQSAIGARPLRHILNTHLHSDHCGGNAALQSRWPLAKTAIPPGLAAAVEAWDQHALTHAPTGQLCERFRADRLLTPGEVFEYGNLRWEILAAEGHDPHSVILFEPSSGILVSADALWNNGFGVVFPELEGESGFEEVGATLNLIESLSPKVVIPGHGPVFGGPQVAGAMVRARSRLHQLRNSPSRHRRHALKVLLKFKLLEWQSISRSELERWFVESAYFTRIAQEDSQEPMERILEGILLELEATQALQLREDLVINI